MRTKKLIIYLFTHIAILLIGQKVIAKDYSILDFGAVHDQLSTGAIQKAVDVCFEAGGGRIIIPAGKFITGTIILKSNVNLYLEAGAILQGSRNIDDYKVGNKIQGIVYCEDAIHVSISGSGTIDAQGIIFYDTTKNHVYDEFEKDRTRQKYQYMPVGTFFTDGPIERLTAPGMTLVFFHCTHVSITGITIKDTPIWATRFGYCDGLLIDGITIQNNILIPNSDGIHCTVSRNIRISNCNIIAGDDAIVMTGFPKDEETPGFTMEDQNSHTYGNKTIYAENVTVTNCVLKSSSSGIRIGYGQHPIRRCIFSNIVIYDSHRGIGIFAHDESNIEDLTFSDIVIDTRLLNGQWWGHGEPIHLSCISRFPERIAGQIKNVQFNNINAIGEQGILVFGLKESHLENIQFNNVQLRIRQGKETPNYGGNFDLRPATPKSMQIFEHDIPGLYAQFVKNLSISNMTLEWINPIPHFFTNGIEVNNFEGVSINRFNGQPASDTKGLAAIKVSDGIGFQMTNCKTTGKYALLKKNVKNK